MWQGPTWSFAILLGLMGFTEDAAGMTRPCFAAGLALVMLSTLASLVVKWEVRPSWVQAFVPGVDLVGAGLMVVADPANATTTMLLLALPVVWLAFEFDMWGLAVGVVAAIAAGMASVLLRSPSTLDADLVLVTGFVVGIGLVARLLSGVLESVAAELLAQRTLVDQARAITAEQLAVMRGVLESIDVAVIVWQADGEVQMNDQAHTMVARGGSTPTNLTAGGVFVHRDDGLGPVDAIDQAIPRALAGEEFVGVVERIGRPGEQRVVVVSARQFASRGAARGVTVLAAWDATDLMDAIRVREEFLATVSHELRTPLTAITSSLELLTNLTSELTKDVDAHTHVGSDVDRLLSAVTRNAGLLQVRIEQLLYSQPSNEQVQPVRTDVAALVEAALRKHESAVALADVQLHQVIETERRHADLDPTRFEQVVDNVVSNAIKYTDPGGTITAQLVVDKDHVVFAVADSGVGMTLDEQRQVFDRFYRAPRARAGAIQGLGIGLSLVKSIVECHRGHIDLRSVPNSGTTVTITLPTSTRPRTG